MLVQPLNHGFFVTFMQFSFILAYLTLLLVQERMRMAQHTQMMSRDRPAFGLLPGYSVGMNKYSGIEDRTTSTLARNISMTKIREEVVGMFDHAFQGYMDRAFPMDDLRPISCTGSNSQGGIALTLLDSLDMLYLLKKGKELRKAVLFISKSLDFDIDVRVHVFEVTIRALGGLLSGHVLLSKDSKMVPWYRGELLDQAVSLADKLLPAFDTPTGVPLSWINLKRGQIKGDTRITCTACAGTMLLEFGVLSRLTNNPIYENKAKTAVVYLYTKRSVKGLLGNTFNVDTGKWVRRHAGIGAGIDSYYEYLLKAYLSFGDQEYLDMFVDVYSSIQSYSALSEGVNGMVWPVDIHMTSGRIVSPFVSALGAFWPGLQSLSGQFKDASKLYWHWNLVVEKFKWVPESFTPDLSTTHPQLKYYPLRPEYIESGYILYSDTGNYEYLSSTATFHEILMNTTKTRCGFASISDVNSGRLEDSMESFFLSETTKYLFLMYSNAVDILDHYILSTEAHFLPSFPSKNDTTRNYNSAGPGLLALAPASLSNCEILCSDSRFRTQRTDHTLPVDEKPPYFRIRERRCNVCKALEQAVDKKKMIAMLQWRAGASNPQKAGSATVAPAALSIQEPELLSNTRFFLCLLMYISKTNLMDCSFVREVFLSDLSSQSFQALPNNAVIFQLKGMRKKEVHLTAKDAVEIHINDTLKLHAILANFGDIFFPNCLNPSEYDLLKSKWNQEMEAEFLVDIEEELLYKHDTELTNEEILDRIKKQSLQDETQEVADPQSEIDESKQHKPVTQEQGQSAASTMPMLPLCDVKGDIILSEPKDGCSPLKNVESVRHNVAVMMRGGCSFDVKAYHASRAGAKAMILIHQEGHAFQMDGSSSEYLIRIPCMMVGKDSAETILQNIGRQTRIWRPDWESRIHHTLHSLYGLPLSRTAELICPTVAKYSARRICSWESLMYEYEADQLMHTEILIPANQATQVFVMNAINKQKSDFGPVFSKLEALIGG